MSTVLIFVVSDLWNVEIGINPQWNLNDMLFKQRYQQVQLILSESLAFVWLRYCKLDIVFSLELNNLNWTIYLLTFRLFVSIILAVFEPSE